MGVAVKDRIRGLVYGQAVGDAFGLGTEFLTRNQIMEYYPSGYTSLNEIVRDKHRARWKEGEWTDDTDQFLCVLESLLEFGHVDEQDMATRLKKWLDDGGMGIGHTTYSVLSLPEYIKYPHKAAELIWKMKGRDIAPNGGLMRNGIVCAWHYWNVTEVLENCERVCRLTHYDQRCVDSCKIVAHLIMGELNDTPLTYAMLTEIFDMYDPRIKEYIVDPSVDIQKLELDNPKSVGYILKALNACIWGYYNSHSFEESVTQIVMEGGDADTNACILGCLLGTKYGYDDIPKRWIEELSRRRHLEELTTAFLTANTQD